MLILLPLTFAMIAKQTTGYTIKEAAFWKISILLGATSVFIFANLYSFQPILPVLAKEFNVSSTYISLTFSFSIIGLIIGLNIFGSLSDRLGRKNFILLSLFCSSLLLVLIASTNYLPLILALRFLQGIVTGALPASALAYLNEEIDKQDQKFAIAFYISANAIGGSLGRVMAGVITHYYSWHIALYIFGSLGLITAIIMLFLLPKSSNFSPSQGSLLSTFSGIGYHLKNPVLRRYFLIGLIIQLTYTGIWTYLPFHLSHAPFFLSTAAISSFYLALMLGIPSAPIVSLLTNRFSLNFVLVSMLLLVGFGALLTIFNNLLIITIGLALLSFSMFAAHSLAAALINLHAECYKGTASSLYFVAYYIGVAIGSTLFAPVWHFLGWQVVVVIAAILPISYAIILHLMNDHS